MLESSGGDDDVAAVDTKLILLGFKFFVMLTKQNTEVDRLVKISQFKMNNEDKLFREKFICTIDVVILMGKRNFGID